MVKEIQGTQDSASGGLPGWVAVAIPVVASVAAGAATHFYGWTQPAEVIGAVTAAGTVAAATVALWVAESGNRRLKATRKAAARRAGDEAARAAAVVVVRTEVDGASSFFPGSIHSRVMNLGEAAILDVGVEAIWCLEPPVWEEDYAMTIRPAGIDPGLETELLPAGHELTTFLVQGKRLFGEYVEGPPSTSPLSLFGRVVTVVRWQERSGHCWRRVEGETPTRVVDDAPPTPPAGAIVLWARKEWAVDRVILQSVRQGNKETAQTRNHGAATQAGVQPLPGADAWRGGEEAAWTRQ